MDGGRIEGLTPVVHRTVEMGMRGRDRRHTAQLSHLLDNGAVEERRNIPKEVPGGRPEEKAARADAKNGRRAEPVKARLQLPKLVRETLLSKPRLGRPRLALGEKELALVLADGAGGGRFRSGLVLDPAGPADVSLYCGCSR